MALNAVCNQRLESREKLLANLVHTVEFLVDVSVLKQSLFFLWSGLNNLHSRVKSILRHGAKIRHHLIFSQPSFAVFDTWLESKLVDHSLGEELCVHREEIQEFYYEWAFLHDQRLYQKFVDVLRVLATRDLDTLTDIEIMETEKNTEISISKSIDQIVTSSQKNSDCEVETKDCALIKIAEPLYVNLPVETSELHSTDTDDGSSNLSIPIFSYALVSPVSSPPQFSHMTGPVSHSQNNTASSSSQDVTGSCSTPPNIVVVAASCSSTHKPFPEVTVPEETTTLPFTLGKPFPEVSKKSPSFLESGGFIQPPALGHFPLPHKGQSVTSFLSSLSDTMPELDRENAHFNVSEALISAFERLKVNRVYDKQEHVLGFDEMEDMFGTVKSLNSPDKHRRSLPTESSRKFYSGKRFPRPPILHTETEESEIEYWKQQPRRPPIYLKKKPRRKLDSDGRSESVFSTTEISSISSSSSQSSTEDDIVSSSFSAEHVALNLLRNAKMKDKYLPPACELQWLVSESDAPQTLLPLPKNWTTSASESESDYSLKVDSIGLLDKSMRLRGTNEWAPPRPQIIFTVHPPPTLKILTETQRYRCAGCGMRVEPKYASTFRYCFYLGRYFCTGCHTGKKARLPQMVLQKWDFSPYMVSNFSATLLESLQSDPVYNVLAINPNLTKKVKLNNFRNYRIQLGLLNEYLKNCKAGESLYEELKKFPTYYTSDVDLFSLEDLLNVRFSTGLPLMTKDFVALAIHHVVNCELCRNLGFVCEICKRSEVLFPFQINRASRCPKCSSCYHLKCFNPNTSDCPKCLRITKRRNTVEVSTASIAV